MMQKPLPADQIRVVHLTSVHAAHDTRIFWKECSSLARAGYRVSLVVPEEHAGRRQAHEVEIVAVKRRSGRLARMLLSTVAVVAAGLRQRATVYHFHDPELIPAGLALRLLGKRVIYDVHEDVPRQIMYKSWIPGYLKRPVAGFVTALEWLAGRALSGFVAANPVSVPRFPGDRTALVQNFVQPAEFAIETPLPRGQRRNVAYVGGITIERGAFEMVEAIAKLERFPDIRLLLAGPVETALLDRLAASAGWPRVDYRGVESREGVRRVLMEASAGLVVFHPFEFHVVAQPTKIFEYMSAGLPVIAANFPRMRELIEQNGCGICVPPRDTAAIAAAIEWIFDHPEEAEEMGRRGRRLTLTAFNWKNEEAALLQFYRRICLAN
jgi:glycosyltransferase involved in cell wall biosynthesis